MFYHTKQQRKCAKSNNPQVLPSFSLNLNLSHNQCLTKINSAQIQFFNKNITYGLFFNLLLTKHYNIDFFKRALLHIIIRFKKPLETYICALLPQYFWYLIKIHPNPFSLTSKGFFISRYFCIIPFYLPKGNCSNGIFPNSRIPFFCSFHYSLGHSAMNTTRKVSHFILILIHIILFSLVSVSCESESNDQHVDRHWPRKLLAYSSSFSASIDNLKTSHEASWRSVDTSLRKAPPSYSNPSHNK